MVKDFSMVRVKNKINLFPNKMLRCIKADTILIGYPSGRVHDTKTPGGTPIEMADLAKTLTFGDANREGTPFLHDGIMWNKKNLKRDIKKSFENLTKTGRALNAKIGVEAVDGIQNYIRGGNSPYTKKEATMKAQTKKASRKGASEKTLPLIDTGDLINAVTSIVKEKKVRV